LPRLSRLLPRADLISRRFELALSAGGKEKRFFN
jgi:hypothetical protein